MNPGGIGSTKLETLAVADTAETGTISTTYTLPDNSTLKPAADSDYGTQYVANSSRPMISTPRTQPPADEQTGLDPQQVKTASNTILSQLDPSQQTALQSTPKTLNLAAQTLAAVDSIPSSPPVQGTAFVFKLADNAFTLASDMQSIATKLSTGLVGGTRDSVGMASYLQSIAKLIGELKGMLANMQISDAKLSRNTAAQMDDTSKTLKDQSDASFKAIQARLDALAEAQRASGKGSASKQITQIVTVVVACVLIASGVGAGLGAMMLTMAIVSMTTGVDPMGKAMEGMTKGLTEGVNLLAKGLGVPPFAAQLIVTALILAVALAITVATENPEAMDVGIGLAVVVAANDGAVTALVKGTCEGLNKAGAHISDSDMEIAASVISMIVMMLGMAAMAGASGGEEAAEAGASVEGDAAIEGASADVTIAESTASTTNAEITVTRNATQETTQSMLTKLQDKIAARFDQLCADVKQDPLNFMNKCLLYIQGLTEAGTSIYGGILQLDVAKALEKVADAQRKTGDTEAVMALLKALIKVLQTLMAAIQEGSQGIASVQVGLSEMFTKMVQGESQTMRDLAG